MTDLLDEKKAQFLMFILKKTYRWSVLNFAVLRSSEFWLLAESVILITMSLGSSSPK